MVDYPRVLLVADRAYGQKERAIALFLLCVTLFPSPNLRYDIRKKQSISTIVKLLSICTIKPEFRFGNISSRNQSPGRTLPPEGWREADGDIVYALDKANRGQVSGESLHSGLDLCNCAGRWLATSVKEVPELGLAYSCNPFEAGEAEGFAVFFQEACGVIIEGIFDFLELLTVSFVVFADASVGFLEIVYSFLDCGAFSRAAIVQS